MTLSTPFMKILIYTFIFGIFIFSSCQNTFVINDMGGPLGQTEAPVTIEVKLNKDQIVAAQEGRLGLINISDDKNLIPLQLDSVGKETSRLVMMMPKAKPGPIEFKLAESETPYNFMVSANSDGKSGQVIIEEAGKKILQYNYHTVNSKDVIRYADDKAGMQKKTKRDTTEMSSIYAVPRSDYIHPLYGLQGEMLTEDWPEGGHPHHRAIFWAWPEVTNGSKQGDIYALQGIFARPTGKIEYISGPLFGQIIAENLWMWEDKEAIVQERAVIRVYRASSTRRTIDLTIELLALKDSITIATRNTDSYGGINLRMMRPESQEISFFTDETGSKPIRAWSDFNGIFKGNNSVSGLMVLQHKDNPEYPGDWVEYPNLAWVQPTFPTAGTRYPLSVKNPLVLRYRLIIHTGEKPDIGISEKLWEAFNHPLIR